MAFRPLTEGDCGQINPLSKLTSHITQDHTFAGNHGQIFSNSSDQLVEQFLQETRAMPQSFRMDGKCKSLQHTLLRWVKSFNLFVRFVRQNFNFLIRFDERNA